MTPAPKLWLTSMSGSPSAENATEMVEPLLPWLDGVVWSLNDVPTDAPVSRYLESVKGAGKIIYAPWSRGRHFHNMNHTLFCGPIEEGDYVLWSDLEERPAIEFVSRIKTEIGPMMDETDVDVIFGWGKPYLMRYRETMEYRNSPHWSLIGWNGRGIEWSTIEPDESKVRLNVRPVKRANQPFHWLTHYSRYYISYPAGSNTCALGLDHFPPGDRNQQFAEREERRLAFRRLMKTRGYPLTTDGLTALLSAPLDEELKDYLRAEKVLSDHYHHVVCGRTDVVDSHDPRKALPIP